MMDARVKPAHDGSMLLLSRSLPLGRRRFRGPPEQAFEQIGRLRLLAFERKLRACRLLLDFDRALPSPGVFHRPRPAFGKVPLALHPAFGAALLTFGPALLARRHALP